MYVTQEQPGGIKMAFSDKINREYVYSDNGRMLNLVRAKLLMCGNVTVKTNGC